MNTVRQYNSETKNFIREHELTEELVRTIARHNGYFTPDQVRHTLSKGERIWTSFNFYEGSKKFEVECATSITIRQR